MDTEPVHENVCPKEDDTTRADSGAEMPDSVADFRARVAAGAAEAAAHDDARKDRKRRRLRRWWPALVVAVLLIAAGVFVLAYRTPPEDVLADYLEAIRSGDVDTALEYTGQADLDVASQDFLTADALRDDWTVSALHQRIDQDRSSAAVFDVTITAADGTRSQGRFELTDTDGEWQISQPLINVRVDGLPLDYVEFNGVTSPYDSVWLFPGAYSLFTGVSDLVTTSPTFIAVPENSPTSDFDPEVTGTDTLDTRFETVVRTWLDDCAESKTSPLEPEVCPLWNGFDVSPNPFVSIDGTGYDVEEFDWTIEEYPSVHAVRDGRYFALRDVDPGLATLTGSGTDAGGAEIEFTASCDLKVAGTYAHLALQQQKLEFDQGFGGEQCVLYPS